MGRARSTKTKNAYRILVGKPEGKDHWEDLYIGEKIILKCIFREIGWGGVDWIDLAEDRDQWRTLVNTVMNLQIP
jgi:hypothetical protein